MSSYDLLLALLGLVLLAAAWLPCWLRRSPISLPMLYVVAGMALPWLWPTDLRFDPIEYGGITERLTELAVILSLTGAGLKLDRDPS